MRTKLLLVCALLAGTAAAGDAPVRSDVPPPAPREETVSARPGFIWVGGYWTLREGQWAWLAGHWEREHAGMVMLGARWEMHDGKYELVPPHWEPLPH